MLDDLYFEREQSQIKHTILNQYLDRFSYIIGSWASSITYVDCFSGPWMSRSKNLDDTSFAIALKKLRKAQKDLLESKRVHFDIRCFFLESDSTAFEKLDSYAAQQIGVEIERKNKQFGDAIDDIKSFIDKRHQTFTFFFIDPKGWTGFSMKNLAPLLNTENCEVLVNFMTSQIRRFAAYDDAALRQGFCDLYGNPDYLDRINELTPEYGYEDALVIAYCEALKKCGSFKYVSRAIILNPRKNDTHYHLIYATRHTKGLEVFKRAEEAGMAEQEKIRAKLNEPNTVQLDMFPDEVETDEIRYYKKIREEYLERAKRKIDRLLRDRRDVSYDDLWIAGLLEPLTWKSDLDRYLESLRSIGVIKFEGLVGKERVLKPDSGHKIVIESRG